MAKTKCIIGEPPIMFGPSLAVLVGVEAAIIIQRVEFLCQDSFPGGRVIEGNKWIWNTYQQWREKHFPFWSERTIQRHIQLLEEKGWLLSIQDDGRISRKKFYRVSPAFKELATLELAAEHANLAPSEHASLSSSHHANLAPSITESTTESPPKRTKGRASARVGVFSDENRRPIPKTEKEMYATLNTLGIEPDEDHDGNFFQQMQKARWRLKGKQIADWTKVYQGRLGVTQSYRENK